MRFVWDPVKARNNKQKHRVDFEEATTVFGDPNAFYDPEPEHPERGIIVGTSNAQRLLFVVHIEALGDGVVRIISARKATPKERHRYEEKDEG